MLNETCIAGLTLTYNKTGTYRMTESTILLVAGLHIQQNPALVGAVNEVLHQIRPSAELRTPLNSMGGEVSKNENTVKAGSICFRSKTLLIIWKSGTTTCLS